MPGRPPDIEGYVTAEADRRTRFEALFAECHPPVRAYALRRAPFDVAQDVVAETFLVAWRRLDDVPRSEPLPWLYRVARGVLANARRSAARADALVARAGAAEPPPASCDPGERLGDAEVVRSALAALSEADREVIMLVAWEGLDAVAAARAAGCSRATFAVRLHRARRRLAAALAHERDPVPDLEPVES